MICTNLLDELMDHIFGINVYIDYAHIFDYHGKTSLNSHVLNNHASKEEREKKFKYYCKICDHGTFSNTRYKEHLQSKNHLELSTK